MDGGMNSELPLSLPNLFLADLPSSLALTPGTVREACAAIGRNRDHWLSRLRTRQVAEMIAYTAEQWLLPDYGLRRLALQLGSTETGFGTATLSRGLDSFFRSLTLENLEGLLAQDLGDARRLDEVTASVPEVRTGRSSIAHGPRLLAHIAAGNIPVPTLHAMTLGLLVRSAQFIKCPSGASILPRLFAHSLAQTEPKLGSCMELAQWPGGQEALEDALFASVDCLTATGSDETLHDLRRRIPPRLRLLAYGHRLSFAYVTQDVLTTYSVRRIVRELAADVTAWNQAGCLSPHAVYVEERGVVSPEGFAEMLASELAERERTEPRGPIPASDAAYLASVRDAYTLRAAQRADAIERRPRDSAFTDFPRGLRIFQSENSTAWTVVYDEDPRFKPSCLHRFVYVRPATGLDDVLRYAEPFRGSVSTVALAAVENRTVELARELARWGVPRVCPVGRMQDPPFLWRHDGRPSLGDLVSWTDLETS